MKGKFSSSLIIIGIELMLLTSLFRAILPSGVKYFDDIFCLAVTMLLLISVISSKRVSNFFILIVLLISIGLMGNLIYGIQPNFVFAITDVFMFLKPYILLMFIITTISPSQAKEIYRSVTKISKLIIVILFVFSIISFAFKDLFADRLSVQGYFTFYSGFTGTVAMTVIVCMAVIVSDVKNNRLLYYILSALIILRTGSGIGILSIAIYTVVYWFFEKKKRFHVYYFLIIVPVILLVGKNEITGYLLNTTAPRYLLFYYSFVTAWSYLPIGSGFATYGSSLAATQYSSLYYRYGFDKRWGMQPNNTVFLMDSYYPQIIGQTGFLGSAIYGTFIYKLFFKVVWEIHNISIRSASIFLFASWLASGLGFGCGSSWGCLVYAIIPIMHLVDKANSDK